MLASRQRAASAARVALDQVDAVKSGQIDCGFIFNYQEENRDLFQIKVATHNVLLAVPKGHQLTKSRSVRLRELRDTDFVFFPRRQSPAYFDLLMHACMRGGLRVPRIVQEAADQAAMLSLVTCRLGVAFVSDTTRWRCPEGVALLKLTDLDVPLPFSLVWRKENGSPLLRNFITEVERLVLES